MPKLNENYLNVQDSYLFAEIARRVKAYEENHPDKAGNIIRLGIGDVTRPLTKSAVEGLHKAVDEQTVSESLGFACADAREAGAYLARWGEKETARSLGVENFYQEAVEKLTGKRVKEKILYSFYLEKEGVLTEEF